MHKGIFESRPVLYLGLAESFIFLLCLDECFFEEVCVWEGLLVLRSSPGGIATYFHCCQT